MKIEYRYGNILNTEVKYIGHCVNAQGRMRSGVAKAIRDTYPKAYTDYMEFYEEGKVTLGKVLVSVNNPHTILHIVGQQNYGYDGKQYVDYLSLRKAFKLINKNITEPVAFPLIGCGLAGGDWRIVSSIIEEEATNFQPIVYTLDDEVPF